MVVRNYSTVVQNVLFECSGSAATSVWRGGANSFAWQHDHTVMRQSKRGLDGAQTAAGPDRMQRGEVLRMSRIFS